jgi:hypothetical protein
MEPPQGSKYVILTPSKDGQKTTLGGAPILRQAQDDRRVVGLSALNDGETGMSTR